jgi:hypothetical protein
MNKLIKPASLLLYLLTIIVFFVGGLFVSKFLGAGKGQMLAGGAIVLFYGLVTAGLAFIASLFVVRSLSHLTVVKINKVLGAIFIILASVVAYKISTREKNDEPIDNPAPKPTAPVDKGMFFGRVSNF